MAQDSPHSSPMLRNFQLALVLAALCFASAIASPAHPVKKRAAAQSSSAARTTSKPSGKKATSAPARTRQQPAGRTASRATGRVTARATTRNTAHATAKGTSRATSRLAPRTRQSVSSTRRRTTRGYSSRVFRPRGRHVIERDTPADMPTREAASFGRTLALGSSVLRGSHDSLVRQNDKTEADHLERIQDDDDLADRIARGVLVPVPVSDRLTINQNLPGNRRYCRPWTAAFLTDLARAHAAAFHSPLEVSSAVRTVEYQKRLIETNGNAAAAEGEIASPHLTGATIDIAKQGMTGRQLNWMRHWLLTIQNAGKIDVEEEFRQACFHITVYKSYQDSDSTPQPASDQQTSHGKKGADRPAQPADQPSDGADSFPARGI